MSSSLLQGEASLGMGVSNCHVPSFLQLSFDPHLLERSGVAALAAHRQQQPAKPMQQSPALQRPPLPPSKAVDPSLNSAAIAHQPNPQQIRKQQLVCTTPTAASGERNAATVPSAQPAPSESVAVVQTVWTQHVDAMPEQTVGLQQHAQQYSVQHAMAAYASSSGPTNGSEGCYQTAAFTNGVYGHHMAQAEYAEGAVAGRTRSVRGRGHGARTSSETNSEADEDYMGRQQQQQNKKRRKKEPPSLQAESQLLLLGFLSAVVGDNTMLEQCLVHAVSFETQQEALLQQQLMMMPGAVSQPNNKVGVLKQYQLAQSLAKNVRGRAALSLVWQLPLAFDSARSMLAVGGVFTLDEICRQCAAELNTLLTHMNLDAAVLHKSKLAAQIEILPDIIKDTMEQLLVEAGHVPDRPSTQRSSQATRPLPRCIVENREPFAHKEWRKEPYAPRPYVELTDYAITSNVASEAKQLKWKLSTRRRNAAGDGFAEKHHDLTPEHLKEKEEQLVQQVLHRRALVKNLDVIEVDCWGMDCYTRRNVFDAVLEANVFKHLRNTEHRQQQHEQQPQQQSSSQAQQQQLVKVEFEQQQQQQEQDKQQQEPQMQQGAADTAELTEEKHAESAVPGVKQQLPAPTSSAGQAESQQAGAPQQQQRHQESQERQPKKDPSPPTAAGDVTAQQQQQHQQRQPSVDPSSGSPESGSGCGDEVDDLQAEGEAQRKSRRARKRVMHADEAMEELKAQVTQHKKANRETLLARYYAPREDYSKAEEEAVHEWIDSVFIPSVNAAGDQGWDMVCVATSIKQQAEAHNSQVDVKAAEAILNQFNNSGYPWFRLHPKGRGVIVVRPEGIPPFTFVEEYLGEVHTGWRWFEIQDAIKKITQKDLPDFYNIALERPRDDPDGYDIMFVDAAFMGSFASRMSHSCTPNCQAVVVSSGGKLTVALYTIRHVAPGEELTFDYSCVTETEDEFKQAYCMCSTRHCRGSYLYYTGSKAYMQVLEDKHTFLDRQALLLRCCTEPLTDADRARLEKVGLRGSVLGRDDVACNPGVPDWLKKWAALTLEFVEQERQLLPGELQALPPPLTQSPADSVAAAVGVELNRLQNICISLDKAKHCLNQSGQSREPPLTLLNDDEVAEHLWNGDKSVVKRAIKAAAAQILEQEDAEMVQSANTAEEFQAAAQHLQYSYPLLAAVITQLAKTVTGAAAAREELQRVVAQLRDIDIVMAGGHTRAADVLQLYASTQVWFTSNRDYISFTSPTLELHEEMISMHGGLDPAEHKKGVRRSSSGSGLGQTHSGAQSSAGHHRRNGGDSSDDDEYDPDASSDDEEAVRKRGAGIGRGRGRWGGGRGGVVYKPLKGINPKVLEKRYGPHYIWAQLSGWYKQTVYDPTASLSADRRGTLSLPEMESCYGTKERYDAKERQRLISHLLRTPERQWTSSVWSFRNEAKVYGSPVFDAFWGELMHGVPRSTSLEQLAEVLRAASLPYGLGGSGAGRGVKGGGGRGVKKAKSTKAAGSSRTGAPKGRGGGSSAADGDGDEDQVVDAGEGAIAEDAATSEAAEKGAAAVL